MRVISVNVGTPRSIEWKGQSVRSSIVKTPVAGRVAVRRMNLEGDAQADLNAHGGEHRAVMVYQQESYDYWSRVLQRSDLYYGQFGENLTVEGLADADVCIGDRYQIGSALFEVTQPRVTCYKVGISLGVPEMPALLVAHHRPGFYFRVIQEGEIQAGDAIVKSLDGAQGMSISVIDALLYSREHPMQQLERALQIPALSAGWQWSFRELLASVSKGGENGNAGLTGAGRILAWPGFRRFVIRKTADETVEVRSFLLAPEDGQPLPAFDAGQHIPVRLAAGVDGQTSIRMYSLCGPSDGLFYRIAVKREEEGLVSNFLHGRLKAGDRIEIGAPRGFFTLPENNDPVVLLSAGVGITPVLAMLWSLLRRPARAVWWIHFARDGQHHSFRDEVRNLGARLTDFHSTVVYSRPGAKETAGVDFDLAGHLNAQLLANCQISKSADYCCCGPAAWLKDCLSLLADAGVPSGRVHFERFTVEAADSSTPPHVPPFSDGTGPLVNFVRSRISFRWQHRFNSLLEAAEACNVRVSWSCRSGVCHRCESNLLSGDIAYSPDPLDPAAAGNILICCARPLTDVQLDL